MKKVKIKVLSDSTMYSALCDHAPANSKPKSATLAAV